MVVVGKYNISMRSVSVYALAVSNAISAFIDTLDRLEKTDDQDDSVGAQIL